MSFLRKNGKLTRTLFVIAVAVTLLDATPVFAVTSQDIVSAGSVWLETTIAVAMVFVTAMAFSLQIARGYFLRTLDKFTLRLGADIWWLAYVLIRDGLIFISFIMGLLVFFPGTFLDYPMAVPFMPLSVVFFGLSLIIKLYFDADDNRNAFRVVTVLVFLGTMSWIFGTVFVTETPLTLSQQNLVTAGISANSGFWYNIYNNFSSTTNLSLAMQSFYGCFGALGVIALFGFAHPILHSRIGGKKSSGISQPVQPSVSPVTSPGRAYRTGKTPGPVEGTQVGESLPASRSSQTDHVDYIA